MNMSSIAPVYTNILLIHIGELAFAPGAFEVVTLRNIEKGEQLRFSYGELSDAEFLASWGFVENLGQAHVKSNACNWVALPTELVLQILSALPEGADASRFAARKPALEMLLSDARVTASDLLPLPLATAVQLLLMHDSQIVEWKEKTNAQCAPVMLALDDLEAAVLRKVLHTMLSVAHAAIGARAKVGTATSGDSYLMKAARFVLEGEATLLDHMRKALVTRMAVLDEGGDGGEDEGGVEEERKGKKPKRGEKEGSKKSEGQQLGK